MKVIDDATLHGSPANLQFTWDQTIGENGQKLHLTIKVLTAGQSNAEGFWILSELNGQPTRVWLGLVGN